MMYLCTLSHRITGFANVFTKQMLTHIYNQYRRLSPADLTNTRDSLTTEH
jgi:hypothetical protein